MAARTTEVIVQQMLGGQQMQLAVLQAQLESAHEKISALEARITELTTVGSAPTGPHLVEAAG